MPLGGTFIIVYHGEPAPPLKDNERILVNAAAFSEAFAAKNAVLNQNAESAILESSSPLRAAAAADHHPDHAGDRRHQERRRQHAGHHRCH